MIMKTRHLSGGILAIAALTIWSATTAAADDAGVVRISSRPRAEVVRISDQTVRGQSSQTHYDNSLQPVGLLNFCQNNSCEICCEDGCTDCWQEWDGCDCGHRCAIISGILELLHGFHCGRDSLIGYRGLCPFHTHRCQCGKIKCRRDRRSLSQRVREPGRLRDRTEEQRLADARDRRERWDERLMRSRLGYFIPRGACGKGAPPVGCYTIVYPVDPWYGDCRDGGVYAAEGQGGPVSVPLAPVIHHTYNYGWGIPSSRLTPVNHLAAAPYYGYGNYQGGWHTQYPTDPNLPQQPVQNGNENQ
ncbi:MAG: hypothetical protein R3B90_02080 [Planctomycetaceae bacterium]